MDQTNRPEKTEAAVGWVIALAVALIPLIVLPGLADSFTLPKVAAIRFLFGLAAVVWVVRSATAGRLTWRRTPFDWYLAAFTAAVLMAAWFSTNRELSIFGHYKRYEDIFTLIGYVLVYFVVVNNVDVNRGGFIISAWLAGATLVSVYAVCQYFGYDFWRTSAAPGRSIGTLGNAVFLGSYLAMALPLAFARFLTERHFKRSLFYLFIVGIIGAALVLTFSRGAWVGLAGGLLLLAFFSVTAAGARRRLIVGLALIVLVFAAANLYRHPSGKTVSPVARRLVSTVDAGDPTVATRLWLWRTTLVLIAGRPLSGYGPDTLVSIYPRSLPDAYRRIEPLSRIDKAHNELLNVGATLGLVGLSVYLALILRWAQLVKARRRSINGDAAGIIAGLASYLVAVQFSFSQVEVAVWFWLGLGLTVVFIEPVNPVAYFKLPGKRVLAWGPAAIAVFVWLGFFYVFAAKPVVADYHFQRGIRAEEHGDMATARREMTTAALLHSYRSVYWQRLGRRFQLDGTAGKSTDQALIRQALIAYGQAESLDSSDPNLYTALGSLYTYMARQDRRFEELAGQAYERSLALNEYLPETYIDRGVLLAQQGRSQAALASFRRALALDPDNEAAKEDLEALNRGRSLFR